MIGAPDDDPALPAANRRSWWPPLLVAPFVVWAAIRLSGLDTTYPVAQLVSFTPYVAVAAWLPVALLAWRRRWRAAGVGVLTAVALAACVVPRALPDADPLAGADGPALRVLTANVLYDGASGGEFTDLVRRERPDAVALQEVTHRFLDEAAAADLFTLLPEQVGVAFDGTEGSVVLSRYPLRDLTPRVNPGGFRQARAALTMPDGTVVEIESAHPFSPYSRETTPLWRDSYHGQPAATPGGSLRVLLGDFNATLDHSLLRDLIATGYRDAADVTGHGWQGTWGPYDGDPIPPVVLDRVLADERVGIAGCRVVDVPRSDHRAVVADLVLP